MKRFSALLFASLVLNCNLLQAQDKEMSKGKVGLTFPTTGIIWHVSDRVAVLPNAGYSYSWGDTAYGSSTGWTLGAGVSLRVYAWEWKGLHLFLSPKYSYGRNSGTSDYAPPTGSPSTSTSIGNSHLISGTWGLQYPISERISIYGDYGLAYSRATSSQMPDSVSGDAHSSSIRTGGSWGLILYLK